MSKAKKDDGPKRAVIKEYLTMIRDIATNVRDSIGDIDSGVTSTANQRRAIRKCITYLLHVWRTLINYSDLPNEVQIHRNAVIMRMMKDLLAMKNAPVSEDGATADDTSE